MKVRSFVEGAGVAIVLLAGSIRPAVLPHHLAIYHDPLSATPIVSGLAIDLAVVSIVFAIILILLDRYRPRQSGIPWVMVFAFWVAITANLGAMAWSYFRPDGYRSLTTEVALLCTVFCFTLLLSWRYPRVLQKCIGAWRYGLALVGCCIFWILPMLAYTAIRTRAPEINAFSRSVQPGSSSPGRVIWVLMDELSYDQVFEHRQPDVQLPQFDELRASSVVFSNVQPVGYYTDRILPSLFAGRTFNRVRSSLQRDLFVHDAALSRWVPFDEEQSVFGEAKKAGWTTGIVGWYNPYCHILQNVLDSCYWQSRFSYPPDFSEDDDEPAFLKAIALPFGQIASSFGNSNTVPLVQAHAREYQELMKAADALIQNESIQFVFLHLPVPHPPGIYDRKTNTMGVQGTYLDNLVLADKTVGNLLEAIRKTGAASTTTLIVCSDHSWRVNMWRAAPLWTEEEERASNGKFDPRPFLLIHFAGSAKGELRTQPFPGLALHGIIESMLKRKIQSQSDMDQWLDTSERAGDQNLAQTRNTQ